MSAGTDVGSVQINLRLAIKDFSDDIEKGKKASHEGAKDLSDAFKGGSENAKASLALLGEEIGVTVPRHLRSLIVEIPGVGEALGAAFSSVAVLALISVLVEAYAKLQEYRKKVEEIAKAWDETKEAGENALRSLGEELLDLQKQIAILKGDYITALKDQIKLIDEQTLDKISKQFDDLGKKADEAFKKMAVGGFWSFLGQGNDDAVKSAQKELSDLILQVDKLKNAGDNAGIGKLLDAKIADIKSFVNVPFANDEHPEVRQAALQHELDTLTSLKEIYKQTNETASDKKTVANLTDQARALHDVNAEATRLYTQYMELSKQTEQTLRLELDGYQQREQKINDLIGKWGEYKTEWEAAHKGISALANGQIEALQHELQFLDAESKAAINMALTAAIAASKQAQDIRGIGNASTNDKPVYGGTAEQAKLYELQTNQNEAVREGQKVFTETRYASEQYAQALAELDALLKSGAIDQDTYDRRLVQIKGQFGSAADGARDFFNVFLHQDTQARDTFDLLNRGLEGFKDNLAQTLAEGTANWAQYFASLDEMLLKMSFNSLFKSALGFLNNSDFFSGLGGGNLFGSGGIFSGLPGKASGGPVFAGHAYMVGEHGPEPFIPSVPGHIIPNGAGLADGGTHIQVIQNISTPNADSFGKSQDQLLSQALRRAAVSHARSK